MDRQIKFTKTEQALYVFKSKMKQNTQISQVNTVDNNKTFFSHQQIEKTTKAKLYYTLSNPSIQDCESIQWMNAIISNPLTTKNINIAKQIFGMDISALKKAARR
jgi:hypothetical protein